MAGIQSVQYIDCASVSSVLLKNHGYAVTLNSGHTWQEIEKEEAVLDVQPADGYSYNQQLTVEYRNHDGEAAHDLSLSTVRRYLVRLVDYNGVSWLLGDTDSPMRLTIQDRNEGEAIGVTGYTLVFSARTKLMPLPIV